MFCVMLHIFVLNQMSYQSFTHIDMKTPSICGILLIKSNTLLMLQMVIVRGEVLTLVWQNHSLHLTHTMLNLLNFDIVFLFRKHFELSAYKKTYTVGLQPFPNVTC